MYNILVVEDERRLRDSWVELLHSDGLAATGFETAEDALAETSARLGTAEAFHLAVVDLGLATSAPLYSSDQWALPRELAHRDPGLLLILVTARFVEKRHRIQGLQLAPKFLTKGELEPDLLISEIRGLLRIKPLAFPQNDPPAPAMPVFLFEHRDHIGKGRVFTYDSARRVLHEPSGLKVAAGALRGSDCWVLELFLRRPNELLPSDDLPAGVVPGARPVTFTGDNTAKPLTQAVSRIGRVLNPCLDDLAPRARFFTNRPNAGYIFNAAVRVSADG